ncbi:hypothetical protein KO500_08970 [Cellulophaga baltica]|uniref:hypothetical protein n=1 Tax=Cellulophaga TaxID=104264 RepID=UPI001C07691F|nr:MULTISPECIES: hypothetical protein [Cellulophaga]MBU2996566.1 hypothetical protein [Cellulophaga baltica]MDO6767960.1 hypothetical protein [Cellulophaga sp. 1_MG-2023]
MKAIVTIIFVLFIGLFANAQDNAKVESNPVKTEQVVIANENVTKELNTTENSVARLYMDRNYKVKKELAFKTKANKSKLA